MLLLGLLALIGFWITSYVRDRVYDTRVNYGRDVAEYFDLNEIFETAYLGGFEFDAVLPNEAFRKEVELSLDRGVETRLALFLAKRLPTWVLKSCAKDIKLGQYSHDAPYVKYIYKQLDAFTAERNTELIDLLNKKAMSASEPVVKRRRRRR